MLPFAEEEAPAQTEELPLTLLCVSKPRGLLEPWSPQLPPRQCWGICPTGYI